MLVPSTRRAGVFVVALFILLVVALTIQLEPRTWSSFRMLKEYWQQPQANEIHTDTTSVELGATIDILTTSILSIPTPSVDLGVVEPEITGDALPQPSIEETSQDSSKDDSSKNEPPKEESTKEESSKDEPSKDEPPKDDNPKVEPESEAEKQEESKPKINVDKYLWAISDFSDTSINRVSCPSPDVNRYKYLSEIHFPDATFENPPPYKPYLITLNLHECIKVIPRLLGSIVEVTRVLGPHNVALRIVEGRSTDGTYEVLSNLKKILPYGVEYLFESSQIDPSHGGRIGALAELRNLAINPLITHPSLFSAENTIVIFLNDVAACPDDILELIHQKVFQKADMTCAMDWNFVDYSGAYRLTFYDVWIARTMSGLSFFHIPFGGKWNESMYLFYGDNDADRLTKTRFERGLPFQVFTCWNGGVVFDAGPIMNENIRFRLNREDECYQGEVSLFTKDLWLKGHGRIAVIPSVNLAYDDTTAKLIQKEFGLPDMFVRKNRGNTAEMVPWKDDPPEQVMCIPDWVLQPQYWVPWNE